MQDTDRPELSQQQMKQSSRNSTNQATPTRVVIMSKNSPNPEASTDSGKGSSLPKSTSRSKQCVQFVSLPVTTLTILFQ